MTRKTLETKVPFLSVAFIRAIREIRGNFLPNQKSKIQTTLNSSYQPSTISSTSASPKAEGRWFAR
jgi:hypothetical protein